MKTYLFVCMAVLLSGYLTPPALIAQHHGAMEFKQLKQNEKQEVDSVFQDQLTSVYQAYLILKNNLVSTDPVAAGTSAEIMQSQLGKVDISLLDGKAHLSWMQHVKILREELAAIQSSSDIEEQRVAFSKISNALYHSIIAFGIREATVYYQYCPMAMGGDSAYWLSEQEEIANPYFGSKMMKCGKTVEEL